MLHHELYGEPLPCTYLQTSTPDMMMFSPHLVQMVSTISVDQSGWVPGHHPLTVVLDIPQAPPTKTTWRLPTSWIPFSPPVELIQRCYEQDRPDPQILHAADIAPTHALRTWATQIESAVSSAIALQHTLQPEQQPYGKLPRQAHGRCSIPKLQQVPQQRTIKNAWHGHYNPELNTAPIRLRQQVRQVRRIQSLRQRLQKLPGLSPVWTITRLQLLEEWQAILRVEDFVDGWNIGQSCQPHQASCPRSMSCMTLNNSFCLRRKRLSDKSFNSNGIFINITVGLTERRIIPNTPLPPLKMKDMDVYRRLRTRLSLRLRLRRIIEMDFLPYNWLRRFLFDLTYQCTWRTSQQM